MKTKDQPQTQTANVKSRERRMQQRLEAWMDEVTALLCYQPEIPMVHKQAVVEKLADYKKQDAYEREQVAKLKSRKPRPQP